MTINGFDMLFYTVGFIVPGFVWCSMVAIMVPQKGEQPQISFLRYLTFSCANYAVWSWLIYLLIKSAFFTDHVVRSAIAWGTITLVSPVVLGLMMGHFSQSELVLRFLRRLGLNPVHPIPTAWDFKFNHTRKACWVLVTMKDGSKVAGLYGSKSFASSAADDRDLYVQQVYRAIENAAWQKIEQSDGILIRADQIRHIEFWND